MDFFVISIIAAIVSVGIFTLMPPPLRGSILTMGRRMDMSALHAAVKTAASAAGSKAALLRNARRREQVSKELFAMLSVLRNHASADAAGAVVTTDCILEQFAQTEGVLDGIYAGVLRLLRTGRRAEAAEYFSAAAGVELARDYIMIVLDWDAVTPHKLKKTVSAFQNALKEARTTELIRKNETLSDIIYIPVVAGVLVIFINFIYVAYFAEQRALLAELFF